MRTVAWFSCGAASAVMTKLSKPDVIAYCDTGSEDDDNSRFMLDCKAWFGQEITILRSEKYVDTWDVWESVGYIAGISGAPCTRELKRLPREKFQKPGDIHLYGYTNDKSDRTRFDSIQEMYAEKYPDIQVKAPLIESEITKANCLALIESQGLKPPRVYEMGFPCANCRICPKASSPNYYALVRKEFPVDFYRMAHFSRELGAKLTRINNKRIYIDEIPDDWPTTESIAPECDFLCQMVEL